MRRGMQAFTANKVDESISLFDAAAAAGYPKALLWQRGLSLYYAKRFNDGASQFRRDVELNPNDTEESIWAMLCEAQTLGFDEARRRMFEVNKERRPVMEAVYAMFRGDDEAKKQKALEVYAANGGSNEFYAALYLGLFAEARGDAAEAQKWINRSAESSYARSSGDYMADLARVHVKLRGGEAGGEL